MEKQELFDQITELYQNFVDGHNGSTKRSQVEARKALQELKKLVSDYRKASVDAQKS